MANTHATENDVGKSGQAPPLNAERLLGHINKRIARLSSMDAITPEQVLAQLRNLITAGTFDQRPATVEPPSMVDNVQAIIRHDTADLRQRIRHLEQQREVDIQTLATTITDHRYRLEALEALMEPTPLEPLWQLEEGEAFPGHNKILEWKEDAKEKAGQSPCLVEVRYWQGRRDAYGIAINIIRAALNPKPAAAVGRVIEVREKKAPRPLSDFGLEEPIVMTAAIGHVTQYGTPWPPRGIFG